VTSAADVFQTLLPTRRVGPARVDLGEAPEEVHFPLATYETPLWPSTARGARVTRLCEGGIQVSVLDDRMTRSVYFETPSARAAAAAGRAVLAHRAELEAAARASSRFARLIDVHLQQVGRILYVRFAFTTGDASGHNMATRAAEHCQDWLLAHVPGLAYGSLSANLCTDKKVSAVNGLLGRGKSVVAELVIPAKVCSRHLRTTAAQVAALNVHKNLVGTSLAGAVRSANAHFANLLLAFYLATGQDAANIIEGSQGYTSAEDRGGDLVFAVTLPNLILGAVGNGKHLPGVQAELAALGCAAPRAPGENARRLAGICAAAVLCGELSLMAALTRRGELMDAHLRLERGAAGSGA
jgi:hydroxymethylglutaryl-CoA reductase (NADPH)